MPAPEQLLAIRRYLLTHHAEFRRLLGVKKLRAAMSELEGHRLTRPPRGFAADSPALDLILARQWGVSATLPADLATLPTLLKDIVTRFTLATPMIDFLNRPILENRPEVAEDEPLSSLKP